MAQQLRVLQSLWAMERRLKDEPEWPLQTQLAMIRDAGFDGAGVRFIDPDFAGEATRFLRAHNMIWQAQCYPSSVDDLKPVLELVAKLGADHVNLQPDVRPYRLADCIPLLEGWRRLGEEAEVAVNIETHRDRMTTDLHFTLDLLDARPDLKLLGDISHYLVGREFAIPVSEENHAAMHQVLGHSWAFHGRVASREQVQIEISFEPHRVWVDLFLDWWRYGFASWKRRAGPDDTLVFTCELGPKPYAIIGRDGNDTTDRWAESLLMRDWIRELWNSLMQQEKSVAERKVLA